MMKEEQLPMLRSEHSRRARHARLARLPLVCAIVGALVAPLVLLVDMRQRSGLSSDVEGQLPSLAKTTTATMSAYELNADGSRNLLKECKELYFTQALDHFVAVSPTYEERYFVCDKHSRANGSIFFYVGNEADVELYLNNTGLMWENAEEFGAMLVFAEHRYFGKSIPFGDQVTKHMQYLSTEQALADYAVLIEHIKRTHKLNVPVIGFGGSYGGMLGSWFRMKYPHLMDGVIAASAPILSFLGDEKPVDMGSFARVTTFDASPDAGSAPNCVPNIRRAWRVIRELGSTDAGRQALRSAFSLCDTETLASEADVEGLISWIKSAYDYMAMGNFPYPSPYIMNGQSVLPAYPVRVACEHLRDSFADEHSGNLMLLQAFRDSVGVYYNSTLDQTCYQLSAPSDESAHDSDFWQYLYCSEMYQPSITDGVHDMFWDVPWNMTADNASCLAQWGTPLRPLWATTQYGGRKALRAASNMVLSNGNYDPWSGGGVLENFTDSVVYVPVDGGAHHLDLFFSNELDPPAIKEARAIEKRHMWTWVREFYAALDAMQQA